MTAKALAALLRAAGLTPVRTEEADEEGDAVVQLPKDLHVQICDYPIRDGGLTFVLYHSVYDGRDYVLVRLHTTRSPSALATRIKKELAR